MTTRVHDLFQELSPQTRESRVLYRVGGAWLVIGLMHIVMLAASGWQWEGAISFRKPIVFSISFGLLLATIGWTFDRLPDRPRLRSWIGWTLVVSSSIEVALITVQAWRGRASHFNVFEAGDATIFIAMGIAVGFVSIALIATLIWATIERPQDALVRIATIAGLAMVATGLGIGQWIIELGNQFVADNGSVPNTVVSGAAGVAKFPHAIAFHGIQLFIVTALILRASDLAERSRIRSMWMIVATYAVALVLTTVQAIVGQSPSQFSILGAAQIATTAALLGALVWIGRRWMSCQSPAGEPRVTVSQSI